MVMVIFIVVFLLHRLSKEDTALTGSKISGSADADTDADPDDVNASNTDAANADYAANTDGC